MAKKMSSPKSSGVTPKTPKALAKKMASKGPMAKGGKGKGGMTSGTAC